MVAECSFGFLLMNLKKTWIVRTCLVGSVSGFSKKSNAGVKSIIKLSEMSVYIWVEFCTVYYRKSVGRPGF